MQNYLLNNYFLSKNEIIESLFVSKYGLRHFTMAQAQEQYKWGHRIIAFIELCPFIGPIANLVEACIAKLIDNRWLFKGTQAGHEGPVSVEKVKEICNTLNACAPTEIQFDTTKISERLQGGVCTAMSLEFLSAYFTKDSISPPVASEMRTLQAAYNTIRITSSQELNHDYSKDKIEAVANYYKFDVQPASEEIDTTVLRSASELATTVNNLSQGAFLIRIIKPATNEKMEEYGHSFVYIKTSELEVLYDPNCGVRRLSSSERSAVLFTFLMDYSQSFQVSKTRFYQLLPKS